MASAIASGFAAKQAADVARENTDKTNAANRALAEYAYSKDLEMWNLGNKYNDPSAQMARLKAAGLNPNMVYGQSSGGAAGQAGALPKYNAPTMQYNYQPATDIPGMISAFQDFRLKQAEVDKRELTGDLLGLRKSGEEMQVAVSDSRGNVEIMPAWQAAKQADVRKKGYEAHDKYVMSKYSWDVRREQLRKQEVENAKTIAATRNLDLQNDYFAAKAITGLFGGVVGAVGKIGAMMKGASRGAKGALGKGTIGVANQEKRMRALEMGSYYGSQRYK